jgi:hypothetical protein
MELHHAFGHSDLPGRRQEIRQELLQPLAPLFGPSCTKAPSLDDRPFGIISKNSETSNVMRHVFNITFYAFRALVTGAARRKKVSQYRWGGEPSSS